MPETLVELELEVAALWPEADGVVLLDLRDPAGGGLPAWEPGAHLDLLIADGLERQYSLCGRPEERDLWSVGVLREPESRGGSAFVHDHLAVGDRIGVRGPRNNFPLAGGGESRFIAGGIGVTPLVPMVERLAASGAPWRMLYGGRRRSSMAFLQRLGELGGDLTVRPEDEFGLLDLDAFLTGITDLTRVYVCGPEPLIQAVTARAGAWPEGVLSVERFSPREGALDGPATAFSVVLERSGMTLPIEPGQTILEVLEENGVDVPTSCREGTCGTCETYILDGIPDHRDSVLTDSERDSNEMMMICCSRAKTDRLVLDI